MSPDRGIELPNGYIWKECQSIRAKFPMPETWFSREESHPGTRAFFMTRERISAPIPLIISDGSATLVTSDPEGYFRTGLTVNALLDADRKMDLKPSQIARGFMETQREMIPVSPTVSKREGPLRILRRFFKTEARTIHGIPMEPTHYYFELTGNDRTGTLYIISFETPSRLWEKDEEVAAVMIEQKALDWEV